jgi:DNA-binding response OmpR family regulator
MAHLLIVEDEPTTAWALAEGLSDDGYTIDTFRTAEDALAWLRTGASDLVITDLRLPGMSGLDLARRLARGRNQQPVILVSAYADGPDAAGWRAAGLADVFAKPFQMDALRRAVRHALFAVEPRRSSLRRAA